MEKCGNQSTMNYTLLPTPPQSFINSHAHLHPLILTLLWQRGLRTTEEIDDFLNPAYRKEINGERQYDPFAFQEMHKVVERLLHAAEYKERVLVYGDYDADGVCSAVLLIDALERLYGIKTTRDAEAKNRKSEEHIQVYLPHREEEGYGLNESAVEYIKKQEVSLVITCDCGSTNEKELAELKNAGVDTIVLDHHIAPETRPPVYGFVNPKFKQEAYPFKELAACGVVFKVVQALCDCLQKKQKRPAIGEAFEKWSLDLVALATVADMMPLVGENRILTTWGLLVLNKTRRLGLKALINAAGIAKRIGVYEIGFLLAPRINAAGRLDHANVAFDLLRQKDAHCVIREAESLNKTNTERQKLTERIFKEAAEQIQTQLAGNDKILVAYNTAKGAWPVGIVGLVAGKLVQEFSRPSFVIGSTEHGFSGSGRSIETFNLIMLIQDLSDLFVKAGGHPQACGFTFREEQDKACLVDEFKQRAEHYAAKHESEFAVEHTITIDMKLRFSEISWELAKAIERMQPFGEGNYQPLFFTSSVLVERVDKIGLNGNHSRLMLSCDGAHYSAVMFRSKDEVKQIEQGSIIDAIYAIEINEWKGNRTIQLVLKKIKNRK